MIHRNILTSLLNKLKLFVISALFISLNASAQDSEPSITDYLPEIKILESNDPASGCYFFGSKGLTKNYVIIVDNYGTPVFCRLFDGAKSSVRLLEDGTICLYNGSPRILMFMDKNLQIFDTITTRNYRSDGHDWDVSEKGNILLMGIDSHIEDLSQIVEGGQTNVTVKDMVVQEFDKNKNLLYTWKSRDYFDVLDALGESTLAKYTSSKLDYIHPNSIHFDSDTSFILSSRHMNEITKVDRRTREIIWRLGGKNNDFTFIGENFYPNPYDIRFSHQHGITRTPTGTILLFDNGNNRETQFSSSVEYDLDEINMTATLVKRFINKPSLYSQAGGNTQRLHNGNTLTFWNKITTTATEFHPDGSNALILSNVNPNRIEKYLWETKIFETDADTLYFGRFDEDKPRRRTLDITNNSDTEISITSYSTHTDLFQLTTTFPLVIPSHGTSQVDIVFDPSTSDLGYIKDLITLNHDTDTQRVARQVWLFGSQDDNINPMAQIIPNAGNVAIDSLIVINLSEPIKAFQASGLKGYFDNELKYNTIDDYIIFRFNDVNGSNIEFDATISTDKMKITIHPNELLLSDQYYYVAIKENLIDYSGNNLPVVNATFYTGAYVGVNEEEFKNEIMALYPNPTNGKFTISTGNNIIKNIFIYDLSGRLIDNIRSEENFINIDISNYLLGQYVVEIKDDKLHTIKTFKLVKY